MIASTQITNIEIFTFVAVRAFRSFSRKSIETVNKYANF